jgi:hypothetical protein
MQDINVCKLIEELASLGIESVEPIRFVFALPFRGSHADPSHETSSSSGDSSKILTCFREIRNPEKSYLYS